MENETDNYGVISGGVPFPQRTVLYVDQVGSGASVFVWDERRSVFRMFGAVNKADGGKWVSELYRPSTDIYFTADRADHETMSAGIGHVVGTWYHEVVERPKEAETAGAAA